MPVYSQTPASVQTVNFMGAGAAWDTTGPPYICLSHLNQFDYTQYFKTTFAFSVPDVPIWKLKLSFRAIALLPDAEPLEAVDYIIRLSDNTGPLGNNVANGQVAGEVTPALFSYEGDATYWGITLDAATVNSVNFGCVVSLQQGDTGVGRVELYSAITMEIFTQGGGRIIQGGLG